MSVMTAGLLVAGLLVCLFALAWERRESLRQWTLRDLYRGDMRALADVAQGYDQDTVHDQIGRLADRGFVKIKFWGPCRVTLKGHAALLLRRTLIRDSKAKSVEGGAQKTVSR